MYTQNKYILLYYLYFFYINILVLLEFFLFFIFLPHKETILNINNLIIFIVIIIIIKIVFEIQNFEKPLVFYYYDKLFNMWIKNIIYNSIFIYIYFFLVKNSNNIKVLSGLIATLIV